MSNPTTAPPSVNYPEPRATGGTVEAAMHCLYLPTLAGPVRDAVGNVAATPWVTNNGLALGEPPAVQAGLFDAAGLSAPALRVRYRNAALAIPGRGYSFAAGSRPHAVWAVFRIQAGGLPAARDCHIVGGDNTYALRGLGYRTSTGGALTLGEFYGQGNFFSSGVTISPDTWYLAVLTYGAGSSHNLQVYNYSGQAYVTTPGAGANFTGTPNADGSATAVINGTASGNFDLAAAGIFTGSQSTGSSPFWSLDPSTSAFTADLVLDPWGAARGPAYAGGGALTVGDFYPWDHAPGPVFAVGRPSGGVPASYAARLHRSTTDPNFVASGATALGSLQSLATSGFLTDSTLPAGTTGYYRLEINDGASTVYSTKVCEARRIKGKLAILFIGDSRSTWGERLAAVLTANGWRARVLMMGVGGSAVYAATAASSWQPTAIQAGTTLLANALAEAARGGMTTCLSQLGINDVATSTNLATYQERYGNILSALDAAGLPVYLCGPFTRGDGGGLGAPKALARSYRQWLASLHNGTTRNWIGKAVDFVDTFGMDYLSIDGLHLNYADMDGFAVASGMLAALEPGSYTAVTNVRAGTDRGDGQVGTLALPAVATVLSGTGYGAAGTELTGTRTDAPAAKVRSGTSYGAAGTGLSGTLTLPTANQVLTGVPYGEGGDQYTGSLVVSGGGSYPEPGDVRSGVSYGSGQTGTLTLPAAGQVLSGIQYGAGGVQNTGTRVDAPAARVKAGTSYGAGGSGLAGTLTQPLASQVQAGVEYGEGGTELTGTLDTSGGGGGHTLEEIATAVWTLADGIEPGETPRQSMRIQRAALVGKASVAGNTVIYRRKDGVTPAVAVVYDTLGNRVDSNVGTV